MEMGEEVKTDNPQAVASAQPSVNLYADAAKVSSASDTVAGQVVVPRAQSKSPAEAGELRPTVEGYDRFATGELAMVCSNYELGRIHNVREFRRGSRQSPKVVLETSTGTVLIKRRTPSRATAQHIAFSHSIQNHLSERSFPLARLIPTQTGQGALTVGGFVYEVFSFINGKRYDRMLPPTAEAGRALAYFHRLLSDFAGPGAPVNGSYHAVAAIPEALRALPSRIQSKGLEETVNNLAVLYDQASLRVREAGIAGWPRQVIHADYHPGNVIFADDGIRAIVDFDSARIGPRALDVANGAMQFSVTRTGLDPMAWPVELDQERLQSFLGAYDAVEGCILSRAECRALPWLMIEALITEAAIPIAATGRFGQIEGSTFLRMVDRKSVWIAEAAEELIKL
jgi:Ser/Thr protein kinase RdoA (MazF antagonist)